MCDQIIRAHKFMVSMGHPPLAPPLRGDLDFTGGHDKFSHLRKPPIILKRELIERWRLQSVVLPEHEYSLQRDMDRYTRDKQDQNQFS